MRWYCQVYRFQIMEKHIDSIKWKMVWYCQVYRFQIMEKHIDSIKWKNDLVPPYTILLF